MKHRIFSSALALCLCVSVIPAAHASQEASPQPESSLTEELETGLTAYADEDIPTPQEVYEKLIALKDQERYSEGTPWDDSNHSYDWDGGPVAGNITGGTGCAAFAFELSDAAFGRLPARTLTTGNFQLSDVLPGDILRINGNSHSVIVLQVTEGGAVIAEANYKDGGAGVVHWGRALSKAEVEAVNFFITRYPAGYIPPDDPSAGEELDSGTAGNLAWKLTKAGTLTISGSGAMPDFAGPSETPWNAYMSKIIAIKIESGVTNVGSSAFYGSAALSVTIPGSVTAIGTSAFREAALVSVSIPGSVRTIGDSAFRSCANLTSVSAAEGVETIEQSAFRSCTRLSSITLPASIRSVGDSAFFECTELTGVTFKPGSAMVSIAPNIFARCYNLSTVTLPQKVDCISDGMFMNCLMLSSLTVPEGAESIGMQAFASCSRLTQVWIPNTVKTIQTAAFSASALTDIYFSGSESEWNSINKIGGTSTIPSGVNIHYNAEKPAPGGDDEEPPVTPPAGNDHEHVWAEDWRGDSTYHWHECTIEGCSAPDSEKGGYAAHSYGDWVIDQSATASRNGSRHRTCAVCGYTQTESIPATGGSSSSGSSGSSSKDHSSSSGSSNTTSTTTRNPDGSTTTTRTDKNTGTVTETTKKPDGSQTVVETQKDGTVTTRETGRDGSKTETVVNPDGSGTITVAQSDGTTAAVSISTAGTVEATVKLSAPAADAAQESGEAVTLPIPEIQAGRSTASAVTVITGRVDPVKVEIPASGVTPGTVAVIVREDGTEEIIKTSVPTADGVTAPLPDGATVKLVDNSKDFTDITSQYWAADAVSFVSARELFGGTTATTFTPEAPMTRAMLMVVLARLDGTDTSGGAAWYEKGMAWAVANGVSDGSSPNNGITREQLITMLWRYAGSPAATEKELRFTDADSANGYALEALRWAVENGIINGYSSGQLKPKGSATRAQVAQMLMNFLQQSL